MEEDAYRTTRVSEARPSYLEACLDIELNWRVPDMVGAKLTYTVKRLVQDRANGLITEAIERLVDSSRFWDTLWDAIDDAVHGAIANTL